VVSVNVPATVPERPEFVVGERYVRRELHDRFKGNRRTGISPPANEEFIFVFAGPSGKKYGYEGGLREDGTLLHYGVGRVGDMAFEPNNANTKLREHRERGLDLHVFVETIDDGVVSYLGEYEHDDCEWVDASDGDGETRRAVRFRLVPADDGGVSLGVDDIADASESDLFVAPSGDTPSGGSGSSTPDSGRTYTRPELLKRFALRSADGVCQGCDEEVEFVDRHGDPFLEIHHLHRRVDGGPNNPANVIALCPDCHRRRHRSSDGDAFNRELIETAERRNERLREAVDRGTAE
jgi:5-methylcytosine-specific restriction protein A